MTFFKELLVVCVFGVVTSVMIKNPKIVIIGAGASGIAAASKLMEHNFSDVTILEAEDRIGGRVFTTKLGDYWVDLGGQWVHGDIGNPVFDLASPLNLVEKSLPGRLLNTQFVSSQGEKLFTELEAKNISNFFFQVEESPEDFATKGSIESMGDIFRKASKQFFLAHPEFFEHKDELMRLFELMLLSCESASTWNDVVPNDSWGFPGDQAVNWKDKGYSMILDILMKKYPEPSKELPVLKNSKLSTEVVKIDYKYSEERVKIHSKIGEVYEADHVIVTTSLGVLKAAKSDFFDPPLSQQKKHFIKAFGYGSVTKIYLLFEHPWWNQTIFITHILWTEEDKKNISLDPDKGWFLDITGIITVEHKPNLLCIWVTGRGAQQVETIPEQQLESHIDDLMQIFRSHHNVSAPYKILRSQWYTNEHFRGGWSYNSFDAQRNYANMSIFSEPISPEDLKILFAGEATDPKSYSSVHGAISSGWREAERLINRYQKN